MSEKNENETLQGELETIHNLLNVINSLRDTHPDWFFYLEDVDPDRASREEMMDLMRTAPTLEAKFFIFGTLTMRIQNARLFGMDRDYLRIVELLDKE